MLQMIKDYVNNSDQFSRKTAILEDEFLIWVSPVIKTTWHTFNFKLYQQIDGVAVGGPACSSKIEIYLEAHEQTAISTTLHPPKIWKGFVDDAYSILQGKHLENVSQHISNLIRNIKFTKTFYDCWCFIETK